MDLLKSVLLKSLSFDINQMMISLNIRTAQTMCTKAVASYCTNPFIIQDSFIDDNTRAKRDLGVSAAVAGAAIAGASLGGQTAAQIAQALGFSVGGAIEIENLSKYWLSEGEIWKDYGVYKEGPTEVEPGVKEVWQVHKSSWTTAGTSGIIGYCIGCNQNGRTTTTYLKQNKTAHLYIVWHAPYNFNHGSNYLAIGLYKYPTSIPLWKMYEHLSKEAVGAENPYHNKCSELWWAVPDVCGYKETRYYENGGRRITVSSKNDEDKVPEMAKLSVSGFMGSSHKFTIKITIK